MARRTAPPLPKRHASFNTADLQRAITALKYRRAEILSAEFPNPPDLHALRRIASNLTTKAAATFKQVFGEDSDEVDATDSFDYHFSFPDHSPYSGSNWDGYIQIFEKDKSDMANDFQVQIELLQEKLEAA